MNFLTEQYVKMINAISALKNEKGQTLVEYALILVLIAIVVIAAASFLGGRVSNVYTNIGNRLVTS